MEKKMPRKAPAPGEENKEPTVGVKKPAGKQAVRGKRADNEEELLEMIEDLRNDLRSRD